MNQNINQLTATGSYSDSSTQNITNTVTWSVSDTTIATIGVNTGIVSVMPPGQIWGATIGVTATLAPGTPGTASLIVIASDSGSAVAPKMPLQDSHWQALGLSPWGSYWGLQEPSGSNLVSSGSTTIALTASVQAGAGLGPQNQSAEPGWLRNFIVMTGSAAMNYSWPSSNGPGMTKSIAFLCYAHVGQMGNIQNQIVGVLRGSSINLANIGYDPLNANTGMAGVEFNTFLKKLTGPQSVQISDRVHPYLLVVNTSSFTCLGATDVSLITSASDAGSWQFTADGNPKGFGGYTGSGRNISGSFSYFAVATGSVAESLSDPATAGAFLQKLGWNVTWSSCPTDSGTIKLPFLPFHWTSLGLKPWTAAWNMQENAGTSACTNDVWVGRSFSGMNGVYSTIDNYQYPLSAGWSQGWTRGGIQTLAANQHFFRVTGGPVGPFDASGSFAVLVYSAIMDGIQSGLSRGLITMGPVLGSPGAPATVGGVVVSTGTLALYCGGSSVTSSIVMTDRTVHPFMLVYDKTNSRVKLYTDKQSLTGTFVQVTPNANSTGSFFVGGSTFPWSQTSISGVHVYAALATGTLAETFSDDGVASNFLKTLGWTVPW